MAWLDLLEKMGGYCKSPFVQLLCCFLVQLFSPNTILTGETAGKCLSSSHITFKFISQTAAMNDWSVRQEMITLDMQYLVGLHEGSSASSLLRKSKIIMKHYGVISFQ